MACGNDANQNTDTPSPTDNNQQNDPGVVVKPDLGPPPADKITQVDPGLPPDTAPDTAPDQGTPEDNTPHVPLEVRFIAMGDAGTGSPTQAQVAAAMQTKCALSGCDFVVMLGDNIYDIGVEGLDDPQWQTKFEVPYANMTVPFYPVLGNHDNGGIAFLGDLADGSGGEPWKGDLQVQYSALSAKWTMPGRTYDFVHGPAHFFALDTNEMFWGPSDWIPEFEEGFPIQKEEMANKISASQSMWKIAMGHHPYISNGAHGNAGDYEGDLLELVAQLPFVGNFAGVARGEGVLEGLQHVLCGRVNMYLAGHDHNRQWLVGAGSCPNVEFIVSGAGAKTKEFSGSQPAYWQDETTAGFLWVHIVDNHLHGEFIDVNGTTNFTRDLYRCGDSVQTVPCESR